MIRVEAVAHAGRYLASGALTTDLARRSQHAPNEPLPLAIAREGLSLMAGLYWDLGEPGTPPRMRDP
jgi:hypothetical protein